VLHRLGRLAGWLLYRSNGEQAHVARVNLGIAYPEMPTVQREALLRASLRESAITFFELPRIWGSQEDLSQRVDKNGLPEKMARLAAQGKGLILAMPHHGNWEMVSSGVDLSQRITGLYRPPRQAFLEPLMTEGRSIARINMVSTSRAGIKALHEALRNNEVVAILPDQVPKTAGAAAMAAPFFGRDSLTMVLLGRLALRHQAPVLFVWAERQPEGRYRMQYFEAEDAIRDPDPLVAAIALNRAVEHCITANPAQYQWTYRRFAPCTKEQEKPYKKGRKTA
jgi:KDO2-lipid IV(A) lauroyltransferase